VFIISHCLRYIWCRRAQHFGSWLHFCLLRSGCRCMSCCKLRIECRTLWCDRVMDVEMCCYFPRRSKSLSLLSWLVTFCVVLQTDSCTSPILFLLFCMVWLRLHSFLEHFTAVDLDSSPPSVLSLYSVIRMWSGYFWLFLRSHGSLFHSFSFLYAVFCLVVAIIRRFTCLCSKWLLIFSNIFACSGCVVLRLQQSFSSFYHYS
jgi:hypothetical protein